MEPLRGALVGFMELVGGIFLGHGVICGSFVTCCIGFQILLYMCSFYAWSDDGCHSGMSYCAYHWRSVLYFHQACCAAEKFCCLKMFASCGRAFTIFVWYTMT